MKKSLVLKVGGTLVGIIIIVGACGLIYKMGNGLEIISKFTGGNSSNQTSQEAKTSQGTQVKAENLTAEQSNNKENIVKTTKENKQALEKSNESVANKSKDIMLANKNEADLLVGNYNYMYSTNGQDPVYLSSIKVTDSEVAIVNYNGVAYESNEPIRVQNVDAKDFATMFGKSPESFGLSGNSFPIYWSKEINMYRLPNGNLLVSFRQYAFEVLKNDAIVEPNTNVSGWFGDYTVTNPSAKPVATKNGVVSQSITGQKIIFNAMGFSYGNKVIANPKYYIIKMNPQKYFGSMEWSGDLYLNNGNLAFLAVLPEGENLTRLEAYNSSFPSEKDKVTVPIILGSNGKIQVANNQGVFYNTEKTS